MLWPSLWGQVDSGVMLASPSVSPSFLLLAVVDAAINRSHSQLRRNAAFQGHVACMHRHSERSHGRCAAISPVPTSGHSAHIRYLHASPIMHHRRRVATGHLAAYRFPLVTTCRDIHGYAGMLNRIGKERCTDLWPRCVVPCWGPVDGTYHTCDPARATMGSQSSTQNSNPQMQKQAHVACADS